MFKLLRIVLFIGALLVIVVSVNRLLNATTPANAASTNGPLDTATIDRGDIPIVVNATGTIQAQHKAQLQSNGKSAAAANLPTHAQVNRTITSAGYNVQIAQDQLDATKSTGTSAGGIMSAQANLDSAQAQLKALLSPANPDDVKQAQDNLASAQTALDAAKLTLTNTQLTAPIDGMGAQIKLNVGEAAPSSQAVILVDTSRFYVDVPLSELDVANINVGQDVNLLFQAL